MGEYDFGIVLKQGMQRHNDEIDLGNWRLRVMMATMYNSSGLLKEYVSEKDFIGKKDEKKEPITEEEKSANWAAAGMEMIAAQNEFLRSVGEM